MRLNRGELRRDLARASDDFLFELVDLAGLGFRFFLVVFFVWEDAEAGSEEFGFEADVELEVCASPAHTNTLTISAKYKNLRNPTTSF
jgi:hypothetical protein